MARNVCHNCTAKGARRAAFLYTCRACGRKVCRHLCGNRKTADGTATCGRCKHAHPQSLSRSPNV